MDITKIENHNGQFIYRPQNDFEKDALKKVGNFGSWATMSKNQTKKDLISTVEHDLKKYV